MKLQSDFFIVYYTATAVRLWPRILARPDILSSTAVPKSSLRHCFAVKLQVKGWWFLAQIGFGFLSCWQGACWIFMAGLEFFVARHLVENYQVWGAPAYLRLQCAKACRHKMDLIFGYSNTWQFLFQRKFGAQVSTVESLRKGFDAYRFRSH